MGTAPLAGTLRISLHLCAKTTITGITKSGYYKPEKWSILKHRERQFVICFRFFSKKLPFVVDGGINDSRVNMKPENHIKNIISEKYSKLFSSQINRFQNAFTLENFHWVFEVQEEQQLLKPANAHLAYLATKTEQAYNATAKKEI